MPAVQQLLGFDKLTTNRLNQQATSSLVVLKKSAKIKWFLRFSIAIIRKIAIVLYLVQAGSQKHRKMFLNFTFIFSLLAKSGLIFLWIVATLAIIKIARKNKTKTQSTTHLNLFVLRSTVPSRSCCYCCQLA
jgi:hypothetical protein